MEKTIIKKGYTSTLFTVNKENIEDFELLPNHRQLREAQIARIHLQLKQGQHFESQVVINQRGKKMRIIDGGHRITAISRFLDEFLDKQIEINMAVYKDLTDDEELKIFSLWNKGINQSPDDYLNLRKEEIPLLKLLEKDFPCKVTIYSPKDGIKFKTLIAAYLGALLLQKPNSYDNKIDKIIEKAKALGHRDHRFLKSFIEGFITVFGAPSKKNPFSSYVLFTAFMRVYYDNIYEQGETFWDKVREEVYPNPIIRNYSITGTGRMYIEPCVNEMLKALNKGKRKDFFILRRKFTPEEQKNEQNHQIENR